MSEDLESIIRENRPLPDADLEAIPVHWFGLGPECALASFRELKPALQAAAGVEAGNLEGMLAPRPSERYMVLRTAANGGSTTVVAAVNRAAGARDQVRAAIERRIEPAAISKPADIGAGNLLISTSVHGLRLQAAPRVRFGVDWLREVAVGQISGELGLDADGGFQAQARGEIYAEFLAALALDGADRLRLRVLKRASAGAEASSSLAVSVSARLPLPEKPEALVGAILGVQGSEWFERLGLSGLETALGNLAAFAGLAEPARREIEKILGAVATEEDLRQARERLASAVRLAKAACEQALGALKHKLAAELSWHLRASSALIDCSFDFCPAGLAAFRQALSGDFTVLDAGAGPEVRVDRQALSEALGGEKTIHLGLPFLDRKHSATRWEALAKAEILPGEDGRLFAYTADSAGRVAQRNTYQSTLALAASLLFPQALSQFRIAYADCHLFRASQAHWLAPALEAHGFFPDALDWIAGAAASGADIETTLTLSVPGSAAAAWLRAPGERAPEFFEVYSRVSVVVQQALRRWLPLVYFSDPRRYEDLEPAYALVFYQSTRSSAGHPRSEFGYDLVSPDRPGVARPWAARPFALELQRVEQALAAAGHKQLARSYAPRRAPEILAGIARQPRLINALITADTFFIDRLVRLGLKGRELAEMLPGNPRKAVGELVEFAAEFTTVFHRRLRRLYNGVEFIAFGSLLLVEATAALSAALAEGETAIAGTLRLTAAGRARTFVNAAYRP